MLVLLEVCNLMPTNERLSDSGVRSENVRFLNPKTWALKFGIHFKESGILPKEGQGHRNLEYTVQSLIIGMIDLYTPGLTNRLPLQTVAFMTGQPILASTSTLAGWCSAYDRLLYFPYSLFSCPDFVSRNGCLLTQATAQAKLTAIKQILSPKISSLLPWLTRM